MSITNRFLIYLYLIDCQLSGFLYKNIYVHDSWTLFILKCVTKIFRLCLKNFAFDKSIIIAFVW